MKLHQQKDICVGDRDDGCVYRSGRGAAAIAPASYLYNPPEPAEEFPETERECVSSRREAPFVGCYPTTFTLYSKDRSNSCLLLLSLLTMNYPPLQLEAMPVVSSDRQQPVYSPSERDRRPAKRRLTREQVQYVSLTLASTTFSHV